MTNQYNAVLFKTTTEVLDSSGREGSYKVDQLSWLTAPVENK